MAVNTYYFDGTTTDPDSAWTNETNADDGSTVTVATNDTSSGSSAGEPLNNELRIDGTNAPASGGSITSVSVRMHNGSVWGVGIPVDAPSGGWTWAKVQGLIIAIEATDPAPINDRANGFVYEGGDYEGEILATPNVEDVSASVQISKVEIEVTSGATLYKPTALEGDITTDGFNEEILMIEDE